MGAQHPQGSFFLILEASNFHDTSIGPIIPRTFKYQALAGSIACLQFMDPVNRVFDEVCIDGKSNLKQLGESLLEMSPTYQVAIG
nr:hypothetical protein [Candidatus Sigynarchaeota archaeon]